ncbi:MAG: hypothetical protein R3221_05360 [Spongiibacter sp.]|uniref:Uncharacterized protein n=1 Tax=Spongiibacter thalassae TaxID=2721624 RepID=A0ABX1GEM2_9GAMM|nr:hypothetical protein [Spongiibacter thalassae]MDX1505121.1 hypothetical protein [Spongiibacter sp.]NKI17645.1 hypothetical protein [Spongiibacter thalassae]
MKYMMFSTLLVGAFGIHSAHAAEPINCLDLKVEVHESASDSSSCPYYNRGKVSTRFLVKNSCNTPVSGVLSYTREDTANAAALNVKTFAVEAGAVAEVANPCDEQGSWNYQVSQVSY